MACVISEPLLKFLLLQRIPAIVTFSLSGAIGLAAIYLISISWFVAFLYLDQVRIEKLRSGILPCTILSDYQPSGSSKQLLIDKIQNRYLEINTKLLTNLWKVGIGLIWSTPHVSPGHTGGIRQLTPGLAESTCRSWIYIR